MTKKIIVTIIILFTAAICGNFAFAENSLGLKLSGRILLQVEKNGEAWYINSETKERYFLNRPTDAFRVMQSLGLGVTNNNLNKIPVGIIKYDDNDDDNDGLKNRLETALGTDINNIDTDNDGYSDYDEVINNFDPLSKLELTIDDDFVDSNKGKILLQVENYGEAWYIDPTSKKRYYLGRPADAFKIMQKFGLGISNDNINKINIGIIKIDKPENPPKIENNNANDVMSSAANAIRANNPEAATEYFIPEMKKAIEYTLDFLNDESRLTLGNILSGARLTESTDNKKTYSTEVYFSMGGYKVPINFYVEKGEDGIWRLRSL
ncbi:hypothetical protein KAR28_03555 [Candidatus Parcubacteria bacterium]|nr:hypothetical protein [Candidatus Parcubacteria bacterium]